MDSFEDKLNSSLPKAVKFLTDIISIPSVSGDEQQLIDLLYQEFSKIAEVELIPMSNGIKQEEEYCSVLDLDYSNRKNLILKIEGKNDKKIIINAHADTVPAPQEMFSAKILGEYIAGRGACDDKGQIAALYLLLLALKEAGSVPQKSLEIHIVIEEETGGNGTLALTRCVSSADLAIVMEPTDLKILTSARGAVWFRVVTRGKSGHSGDVKNNVSALERSIKAMDIMKNYHAQLFGIQKGTTPFEDFENPMPLTFGKLNSGIWPATVPDKAVLEGVLGFLPGKNHKEVAQELKAELIENIKGIEIEFPFRHNPFVTSRDVEEIKEFYRCVESSGVKAELGALPACCDAIFYSEINNIPSIIFGAGSLKDAHSSRERVKINDICKAAEILGKYIGAGN